MTRLKFEELNLSQEILNAVKDMGFEEASPIQSEAIPLVMAQRDVIGQAQTGTGKTAAFAIPVIEKLDGESSTLQALILCPTRELVIQVSEEFRKLMKYREDLSVVPVYGGQPIDRQLRALKKGPQVVIGTPGRLMDHMRRGSLNMSGVRTVILDEADEMLDMGFRDDIEFIMKGADAERQTVMFSATMAKEIVDLTSRYMKDPIIVNVANKKQSAPKIQQIYFEVQEKNKPEVLARLIDLHNIKLAVVFCNTKSQVDQLVEILKSRGYFADGLHGDMGQTFRDKVMNGFRNGTVEILVATDVAGRGIDVNNVEAVFNYDLPRDDEDYIHRIGRTARAGNSGLAFSFVTGKQIYSIKRIEKSNGMQIRRQDVPTMDEVQASKISTYTSKIAEIVGQGHLANYVNQIEILMGEDYTSLDIAAALLKMIMEKENEGFDHNATFEVPPVEDSYSSRRKPFGRGGDRKFGKRDDFKGGFKKKDKPFGGYDKKKKDGFDGEKTFSADFEGKKKPEGGESDSGYKPFKNAGKKKPNSFKGGKSFGGFNKGKKGDSPKKKSY